MNQRRRIFQSAVFVVTLTGIASAAVLISPGKLPSSLAYAQARLDLGTFATIDPTGSTFTDANGINPRGDIVGR